MCYSDSTATLVDSLPVKVPGPGFVYLAASNAMPGFVELGVSEEDPSEWQWTVRGFSGATKFHCAYAARTDDVQGLEAQFRKVLGPEQIPHHDDLFKVPVRFARQILEEEAKGFPASAPAVSESKPRGRLYAFGAAGAVLAAALTLWGLASQPAPLPAEPIAKAKPAYRQPALQMRLVGN